MIGVFVLAPIALSVGTAGNATSTTTATLATKAPSPVLATLVVKPPDAGHVETRRRGSPSFTGAKDRDRLRQGDTVQTDTVGHAEIDYTGSSYTRLDVSSTFTITRLTERNGARQVAGGLTVGQAWNRVAALTRSGSFSVTGGGASSRVAGTAYAVECSIQDRCSFIVVVDRVRLTGSDGHTLTLQPRDFCAATLGALCGSVTHETPEELASDPWIQANLQDQQARGLGPGPFRR